MSAEALLENPALFSGYIHDLDALAYEYMEYAKKYNARYIEIKAHIFRIIFCGVQEHTDLREMLVKANNWESINEVVILMRERRKQVDAKDKLGWYLRY